MEKILIVILTTVVLFVLYTFLYGKILKTISVIDDAMVIILDKLIGE